MKDIGYKGVLAIGVILVQFMILLSFWQFEGSSNATVYRSPWNEAFSVKDLREPPHICLLVLSADKESDKSRDAKNHPFVTNFVPSLLSSIANDRNSLYFLTLGYPASTYDSTIEYLQRNVTQQIHDFKVAFGSVRLPGDAELESYNLLAQDQIQKGNDCKYFYLLSDRVTFQSSYWYRTLPEALSESMYKDFGYASAKELSGTSSELFGMLPLSHLQIFGGKIFLPSTAFTGSDSFSKSGAFLAALYNPLQSSWALTSEVIRSSQNYGVAPYLSGHQQELCDAYNRIANWLDAHLATKQVDAIHDMMTSKGCKITAPSSSSSQSSNNAVPPPPPKTIVTYSDTCPAVKSQVEDEQAKWDANIKRVQARYNDIKYMDDNPHTKREFNSIPGLMYDLFQPTAECEFHDRVGGASDGGKWICDNRRIINKPCRIYSFGVGLTIAFDTEYFNLGCETWAFDPTPGLFDARISWFQSGMHFETIGLGPVGGTFDNPDYNLVLNGVPVPAMSFGQLRAKYNHDRVDILKIDVEGAEWTALPYLFHEPSFNTSGVKMILLEMHILKWDEGLWNYVPQFFKMMEDNGFYMYQKDANVNLWPGNPPFFCCYEWAWAHKSYLYPHLFNKPEWE